MTGYSALRWKHEIKPTRGKYSYSYESNVSTSGEIAVTVTSEDERKKYGELILFNSEGEIMWREYYDDGVSHPQLSEDGSIIAVEKGGDTLMAYNKRGKLLWTYSIGKKGVVGVIWNYKLSRDGRYTVIAMHREEEGFLGLKRYYELVLLRDGKVVWVKSEEGIEKVVISSNNAYIASASVVHVDPDSKERYRRISLYTIDGAKLWSAVVEGFPSAIGVSSSGEVVLSTLTKNAIRTYFIKNGHVLWTKDRCNDAQFTRNEDRIIAIRERGKNRSDWDVNVFNREGEFLWEHRGAYRFAVADNYYVLVGGEPGSEEVVLVSADGVVLQRIKLRELIEKEVITWSIYVRISPDGKYFAVSVKNDREGMYYLYFFENRDFLIRGVKEKLLKEIDELIKR